MRAVVVQFPEKIANLSDKKPNFNLFEKLSQRLGVDVDKVVFDKAPNEKEKLARALRKETIKERTRITNQ